MKYLKVILLSCIILSLLSVALYHSPFHSVYYQKSAESNNLIHIKSKCSCYGLTAFERHESFNNSYTSKVYCIGLQWCSTVNETFPASNATKDVTILNANLTT